MSKCYICIIIISPFFYFVLFCFSFSGEIFVFLDITMGDEWTNEKYLFIIAVLAWNKLSQYEQLLSECGRHRHRQPTIKIKQSLNDITFIRIQFELNAFRKTKSHFFGIEFHLHTLYNLLPRLLQNTLLFWLALGTIRWKKIKFRKRIVRDTPPTHNVIEIKLMKSRNEIRWFRCCFFFFFFSFHPWLGVCSMCT